MKLASDGDQNHNYYKMFRFFGFFKQFLFPQASTTYTLGSYD
jgi:hypothetical protein